MRPSSVPPLCRVGTRLGRKQARRIASSSSKQSINSEGSYPQERCLDTGRQRDNDDDDDDDDDVSAAILSGDVVRIMRSYISQGVNLSTFRDTEGCSAMHIACQSANLDVCECLYLNGASITAQDSAGLTPLTWPWSTKEAPWEGTTSGLSSTSSCDSLVALKLQPNLSR